jgi:hypothetical protein
MKHVPHGPHNNNSLRTVYGIQYFPRTFFLLFAAFHFYYFSFPHGFAYAALTTAILFMAHSMLFFWHRYELPAVCRGQVQRSLPASPVRYNNNHHNSNHNTNRSRGDGTVMTTTLRTTMDNSSDHYDHHSNNNENNDSSHDRSLLFGLNGEVIMRPSESFLNMQESALQAIVGIGAHNELRQPALLP